MLAAWNHGVWGDVIACMAPDSDCVSCQVSTIRAAARNFSAATPAGHAGECVYLDILPGHTEGLTANTIFPLYLICVDAYSRYVQVYGLENKSI